jgi:hypothetical protein
MEKKALTYTLEIERHDDGYLAYFPALPGCHTWGKTYETAGQSRFAGGHRDEPFSFSASRLPLWLLHSPWPSTNRS